MKKTLLFFLFAGIVTLFINADVYIKQKLHTDSYYYGGVTRPADDSVTETWISDKKMVSITRNRMTIVDTENNQSFVINKNDKTYAKTDLPIKMSKLVPENIAAYLKSFQYIGTVKETGETKKVGKFKCKGYEVNSYLLYEGSKANETDSLIWVTSEVPFDLKKYANMRTNLHRLSNFSDSFITELNKMQGFSIASETLFYPKGFSVKSTAEVIEMSVKDPPAGIYSVPDGYTIKEKLTVRDLRNR
jgi:hypothetical protein